MHRNLWRTCANFSAVAGFFAFSSVMPSTIPFSNQGGAVKADDAESPGAAAVHQFMHARDAKDAQTMYGLWSLDGRKMMPYAQFKNGDAMKGMQDAKAGVPEALKLVAFLLIDSQGVSNYTYKLVGPDPADPTVFLVNGAPAGASASMSIKVFTLKDTDGQTRIDIMKTAITAYPPLAHARDDARDTMCISNVKQIGLGIMQYVQDNDQHYPDADKWVDEVYPYVKNEAVFLDPQDKSGNKWSYAFNRALSHKKLADIATPADTVLIFDSTLGTKNASDTGQSMPKPGRHQGKTVIGFADGHVSQIDDNKLPAVHG